MFESTRKRVIVCAGAAAALALASTTTVRGSGPALRDQIRASSPSAVKAAIAAGAPVNEADDTGATPLMYAAAVGSLDTMRALIDRGADVNAAAPGGSTALMWATGDVAKVRLLLERGADVNAKTTDGTTPLVAAAQRGAADVVEYLLAHGANPRAAGDDGATLYQAAFSTTNDAVRRVLDAAGLKPTNFGQIAPALGRIDFIDHDLVTRYLAVGGDPNLKVPMVTVKMPLLGYASMVTGPETVRLLLERGADPNAPSSRGATPLMMAAASDHADPTMVKVLLSHGAQLDARDDEGRSALDWALLQGDTPVAQLLRSAGAPSSPVPSAATTPLVREPRAVGLAVQKAVASMDTIGPSFSQKTGCISCHNNSLPAMARQMAMTQGIAVEPMVASHADETTVRIWTSRRNANFIGACGGNGYVPTISYALAAMREEHTAPNTVTDALTVCLASRQSPDGAWRVNDVRPPLSGNALLYTALSIRALDGYAPPALRPEMMRRIEAARTFLLAATPHDTQDEAFKLMGLVWSKASAGEIAAQARRVAALQHADGGWSQTPLMTADAYATGQAMRALRLAGTSTAAPEYRRGVEYLLRTQREDGSWFVQSRGFGFQPYREYGFPHGRSQFISAAATSWAVMALAPAIPVASTTN